MGTESTLGGGMNIALGVIGTGGVGSALLAQLSARLEGIRDESGIQIDVRAICASRKMACSETRLDVQSWKAMMIQETDLKYLDQLLLASSSSVPVIIDCTASDDVTARYRDWLENGISVITANKKGNSGTTDAYCALRDAMKRSGASFFYEANVGAGLPIINTLQDLIFTGDRVISIEGVLSGTLSFIFNTLNADTTMSAVVIEAKRLGYTEPDPREDLAGTDVARKVVILAREVGMQVELGSITVQSLVPAALDNQEAVSVDEFLQKLPNYDEEITSLVSKAGSNEAVLRYVGVVDVQSGVCAVELRQYSQAHPFGGLKGSDNIIRIRTERYNAHPLVISGPGAGNDVTAGGVFADLRRLISACR